MHATLALAALASVVSVAHAQGGAFQGVQQITTLSQALAAGVNGYGRFPCTQVNGDGTFSPLQSACTNPINPGPGTGNNVPDGSGFTTQGFGVTPTGSQCVQELETGAYYCGIAGAACTSGAQCDNGQCQGGVCTGGFDATCQSDAVCSGYLYCGGLGSCGENGAFCQDAVATAGISDPQQVQFITNQYCSSGYCGLFDGICANRRGAGVDCTNDPYGCARGLECSSVISGAFPSANGSPVAGTCVRSNNPSARARSRRADITRRNLCPASHTACTVEGAKGFECIDVSSNIEQCGACASAGGVDCTAIEGVAAVGCVAGVCEIWSCEDGFSFDADKAACVAL
ncbi:hypothetical protein JCM10908_005236 [Rhodotorula pacifica]|uniref:uncharacterized protein n=1 Tax=Rhodotorula pacifica TaxID=1495444 RepID=UPI003180C6BA